MITIKDAVVFFKGAVSSCLKRITPCINRIKSASQLHKIIALFSFGIVLIAVSLICSGVRVTYNVKYNDTVLANVSSISVYNKAMEQAEAEMSGIDTEIAAATLQPVITVNSKTASSKEVSQLILKNSPSVCNGYAVYVGDKFIGFAENKDVVDKATNARLSAFDVKGAECESSFTEEVTAKNAYFHIDKVTSYEDIAAVINTLDVQTVAVTKDIYTVKYDTVTKKDSSKKAGYQSVITPGVNGSSQTVTKVTYLNGEVVGEPVVTDEVLEYPVNRVLLIGTKNVYVTSVIKNASASGFKWPLSVRGVISSDYGVRGSGFHSGVDIAVPEGTNIIAVKGGTVVEASFNKSYGYYVLIDHGNGVKTRYAHNKFNTVEAGQKVSAGQLIALSGNTGNSTGPHLHFEVIINGSRVDPGYYIDVAGCPKLN